MGPEVDLSNVRHGRRISKILIRPAQLKNPSRDRLKQYLRRRDLIRAQRDLQPALAPQGNPPTVLRSESLEFRMRQFTAAHVHGPELRTAVQGGDRFAGIQKASRIEGVLDGVEHG